ncbi:MAG: serine/threonine protein kinase, partial [Sandaracinaceae bacterium]|nr:serine/threonine protein kinase [Sandaracinaceae bacterium]
QGPSHAGPTPHTPAFAATVAGPSVRPPPGMPDTRGGAWTPPPPSAPSPPPAPLPATAVGVPVAPPRATPHASTPPGRTSAEQLVGQTLKQTWFVEGLLAAGGMGCVYTARHVRTGKRYAVKTLLPDERISMESLHRFEREARTASSLGHVGIVQVHDFDLDGDPRFLVMDLLEGETLEQRLARAGRLAWPDVKRIALEVADALAAAHHAGVLHRDLKPSNVFLARKEGLGERAVLLDFGLTKPIREGASVWVTRTGAIVGTAHYMSPEQARGERSLDQRADVYGLGALIYEMIAGIPPFLGATPFAVLTSLLTEAPVPPSHLMQGVPPAVDALVLRALAKAPSDRPQDVPTMMREILSIPG